MLTAIAFIPIIFQGWTGECNGRSSTYTGYATLDENGVIGTWGEPGMGGDGAPTDAGWKKIVQSRNGFAALHTNGHVTSWGDFGTDPDPIPPPTGGGFVDIFSNKWAFVAMNAAGQLSSWGKANSYVGFGAEDTPTRGGFVQVVSSGHSFAALNSDGTIDTWGGPGTGGLVDINSELARRALAGQNYTNFVQLFPNFYGFSARDSNGRIFVWAGCGTSDYATCSKDFSKDAPSGDGFGPIVASSQRAFVALNADGSITCWGQQDHCNVNRRPTRAGFVRVVGMGFGFSAIHSDGTAQCWGTWDMCFTSSTSNEYQTPVIIPGPLQPSSLVGGDIAACALTQDGTIVLWGRRDGTGYGDTRGRQPPTTSGWVTIIANQYSFAGLNADGSVAAWGTPWRGGEPLNAPPGNDWVALTAATWSFSAIKATGEIAAWGYFGSNGYVGPNYNKDYPQAGGGHMDGSVWYPGSGTGWSFDAAGDGYNKPNTCPNGYFDTASASGDPHLALPHGGVADFRGEHMQLYNFLSAANLSLNVMTELADFELYPADHPRHKRIHGSFITQAHVVARTNTSKMVRASFFASMIGELNIAWANGTIDSGPVFKLGPKMQKVVDDVTLVTDYSTLRVTTPEFEITVAPNPFTSLSWTRNVVGIHHQLDVKVKARVAEDKMVVAPHGIVGQGWDGDGKAIDGELDAYPDSGEFTTYAMAKGAIEGTPNDYKVATPYATGFKFSRFDATSASPRDVAALVATGELNKPKLAKFTGHIVGSTEYNFTEV
uniref:Uncharacterized protein n=1 Tax=Haptolina brevifila TaxID=156173 RepID=A0A7S2NBN3_9EUKA|mmetsp:Transcript_72810/g.144688  ORF Transcript_72810/g.144688 Transcript_72810/m.144688 type:complete len:771 (+) Transcript_72810:87-2399(+)